MREMKALRKTAGGAGHVELRTVSVPDIGPEDVLMRVYATGVCGSDLLIQEDRHFHEAPVTLGHEFSGVVYQTGRNVTRVKESDKFIADIECDPGRWLGFPSTALTPPCCSFRRTWSIASSTSAGGVGGGLFFYSFSNATLTGNTIQGNTGSATDRGQGGWVYLCGGATTLRDNTVQSNVASTSG